MIAQLRGTVARSDPGRLVLMVGGVGYLVHVTPSIDYVNGMDLEIRVVQVVKEDSHDLYGFDSAAEEEMFNDLCSVPQLGAKTAMRMLTQMPGAIIRGHIVERNAKALTLIRGVGPKVAERIVERLGYKAK